MASQPHDMHERCNACGDELDQGQIGDCDGCQDLAHPGRFSTPAAAPALSTPDTPLTHGVGAKQDEPNAPPAAELALTPELVAVVLQRHDEDCDPRKMVFYPTLHALCEAARKYSTWSQGEIFVFAPSRNRFIIMKQIAPDSCEMLTISATGCHGVITACAFEQEPLVVKLAVYMGGDAAALAAEVAKPITSLTCCCCGGVILGRQFHNQDTGHGLGSCCVAFVTPRCPDMARTYGIEGVHYKINWLADCPC